jgi:hypothetical protein
VSQRSARPDNQIIHAGRNGVHLRSPYEHAKWVVGWDAPRVGSSLGKMYLAVPPSHDRVVIGAACANETQSLPKGNGGFQVIAGNDCKRADARCLRHALLLCPQVR